MNEQELTRTAMVSTGNDGPHYKKPNKNDFVLQLDMMTL